MIVILMMSIDFTQSVDLADKTPEHNRAQWPNPCLLRTMAMACRGTS